MELLHCGLGFVPTPKWNKEIKRKEWENLFQHIRRVEWGEVYKDAEECAPENAITSKKLKVPKLSRPKTQLLEEETRTYVELVTNKLRNIEDKVNQNYRKKNNINFELRKSLQKIVKLVNQKKIVICRSDKDGKTIILNHSDYKTIIEKELEQYELIKEKNMDTHIKNKKEKAENMVLELYKNNDINETLLYNTTGFKENTNGEIQKIPGTQAKYFANMETGYVYPLFKTHKLDKDKLHSTKLQEIPTRLVQATGNTYLARITSFIEEILKPISQQYCKNIINEYCRDSKDYLTELMKWKQDIRKTNNNNLDYKIIAVDVKALYPSIPRNLITTALKDAIDQCSQITENGKEILIDITTLCLDNNFVQFQNKYFKQKTGIITGDNNSVSLANISLHYIIKNITEINTKTEIFKRFIDDILYITEDNGNSEIINGRLEEEFGKYDLKLTFREMATNKHNSQVEFLDVLHCANKNYTKNFIIKDFTKPTATNSTFINGKSFHPVHIFKGIIFGESKRLRRLNETEIGYAKSLEKLKEKCNRSGFKKFIMDEVFEIVTKYENIWNTDTQKKKIEQNNKEKENKRMSVWATSLKGIIKLNKKEKSLVTNTQIVYARPPTISTMITNYKTFTQDQEQKLEGSSKCGKCGLCGNFGSLKNMVVECGEIERKDGVKLKIKQKINCKDTGIYAARCKVCREIYVGQTSNRFSVRWNGHRSAWKEITDKGRHGYKDSVENSDKCALFLHYAKHHEEILWRKRTGMDLSKAYEVIFMERATGGRLNTAESFWITNLKANININKTFLPKIK